MALLETCPHCRRQSQFADDMKGQDVRCAHCGQPFRVLGIPWVAPASKNSWKILLAVGCVVLLLVGGAMAAIVAGLMLPAMARSRTVARQAMCQSNLKQIGLALAMYEGDYDELPPDLSLLASGMYLTDPSVFSCPVDLQPYAYIYTEKAEADEEGDGEEDDGDEEAMSLEAVAFCLPSSGSSSLLCRDWHVEPMPVPDALEWVEEQLKDADAEKRTMVVRLPPGWPPMFGSHSVPYVSAPPVTGVGGRPFSPKKNGDAPAVSPASGEPDDAAGEGGE